MESTIVPYSRKNIPIPSKGLYKRKLVEMAEYLIKRMRWKALFFLKPETFSDENEMYGFKLTKSPPRIPELEEFEKKLFSMIENVKFKPVNNTFQEQLSADLESIRNSNKFPITADKTANYYKMSPSEYKIFYTNLSQKRTRK